MLDQFAAGQFVFHADRGQQRDPVAHGHEAFDGLQGGQFDVHVQRCLVALECLNHFFAIGRGDDVGDERFRAQLPDADLGFSRQRVRGRHHENQFVQVSDDGVQLRFLRIVSEDAQFRVVAQHVAREYGCPANARTAMRIMGCSRRNSASTGNR